MLTVPGAVHKSSGCVLKTKGRAWLLERACPHRSIEKAIAACVGSSCSTSEADIVLGLRSYVGGIEAPCTPPLLCPIWPAPKHSRPALRP